MIVRAPTVGYVHMFEMNRMRCVCVCARATATETRGPNKTEEVICAILSRCVKRD